MLSVRERHFIDTRRIGHLATADSRAVPHVVPVCFSLAGDIVYIAIDQKPKRNRGKLLKRLGNITDNPRVAVVFDHYDEDWQRLGWVMLHGRAEILTEGIEHDRAQLLMRSRYRQLAAMQIEQLPVIAIHIERVASWGDLGS
ncbi:MAG: TIGR03668 family PPOX class F420-dependent oxidoreductase [Reyranella sp.]|nr:TIGR03668 family PPOX class F420-dependent oxidoreductase [Reyranella sp.]